MKLPITAIILTFNEELNLEKCLKSVAGRASEIFVVDSYSTDKTLEIAKKYGAIVAKNPFKDQAQQFNWALDNLEIKSEWILKLDADEEVLPELWAEIEKVLPNAPEGITGFEMKRRVYFMEHWMKHGGYYPVWFLRLWRKGRARSEVRRMDEHIILSDGKSDRLNNDFIDNNLNGLSHWIKKHRNYAVREAEEVYFGGYGTGSKRNIYYRTPAFLRVFLYFTYRYFFQLGFLDGISGTKFHFLHGFWYRWIVDKEVYKLYKNRK
ncbi:MAG: glycosyltransferase family 2 protein [Patescibacteria group bacterium]